MSIIAVDDSISSFPFYKNFLYPFYKFIATTLQLNKLYLFALFTCTSAVGSLYLIAGKGNISESAYIGNPFIPDPTISRLPIRSNQYWSRLFIKPINRRWTNKLGNDRPRHRPQMQPNNNSHRLDIDIFTNQMTSHYQITCPLD